MEIKLPRLKLDYSEDESFSLGKLSLPLIAGFGIHWAWVYLTMFNGETLFFREEAFAGDSASLFMIFSMVFFTGSLFSYGIFSHAFRLMFSSAKKRAQNRFYGAALASIGTILMCFADITTTGGTAIIFASGITTGIGSAILLMSYGVSFSQCDIATIVTSTALSLVVGIAVYAGIYNLDILHPLGALVATLLPFVECYCLYKCSSVLVDNLEFASITLKVRKVPFALRICAPGVLFGFAISSIRTEALATLHAIGGGPLQIVCIGCAALIACSLMIVVMLNQKQHLNFMFRTLLPLMALVLVWMFFAGNSLTFLSALMLLCCYLIFESIMWVSYSDISQRFRVSSFVVFGFGRGALALGALIGIVITALSSNISPEFGSVNSPSFMLDPATVTILALACMLVAFALLPRGSELRPLIIAETDSSAEEKEAAASSLAAPKTEETIKAGRFKRKCETIANRYLLSKKETEVLFLLAKGRNAAYIQEQLFISEGTARTHMRHIYKKLDIHTQQELIDTFDRETTPEA